MPQVCLSEGAEPCAYTSTLHPTSRLPWREMDLSRLPWKICYRSMIGNVKAKWLKPVSLTSAVSAHVDMYDGQSMHAGEEQGERLNEEVKSTQVDQGPNHQRTGPSVLLGC